MVHLHIITLVSILAIFATAASPNLLQHIPVTLSNFDTTSNPCGKWYGQCPNPDYNDLCCVEDGMCCVGM